MTICSGSSCFLTGVAGCLHQRDLEGGMTGGSGGADCAIAEATRPSNGASSTGKMIADAEAVADNPPNDEDNTGNRVDDA